MGVQTRIFALFIGTLLPCFALASTFGPTMLVNTENFTVIDDAGGAGDVELRFGDTVNERLYWNAIQSRFEFTDDVHVQNNLSGSGTQRIEGNVATKADLFLNADNGASNAVLTFGNDTLPETLQFNRLLSRFEFSDDLHVANDLYGSGALVIDGNARFNSTVTLGNVTYTFPMADGGGSGKTLTTNGAGQLSWAEPVRSVTFTDATTDSITDANVDLWDGTFPNISPRSTDKRILISVSIPYLADGNDDETNAFTIHRNINANPTCASTQVGEVFGGSFTTTAGWMGQASVTYLDTPASTGNIRYTVCSNTAAQGTVSNDTQTIRFVLTEVGN